MSEDAGGANRKNVNLNLLSGSDLAKRLHDEQRLRRNAEKRELYSKKKIISEQNSRQLVEKDDRDMKKIFETVNEDKAPNGQPKFITENPEMELFWNIQNEMIENKSRKWHPRYKHSWHKISFREIKNVLSRDYHFI